MNLNELVTIKTLEENKEKRTRYITEIRLFSCVQQGNIKGLFTELENISSVIVAGKMSDDNLQQYKYLAVTIITLAIRYAIQGGLNEDRAYDFSDEFIMTIDNLNDPEEILGYIGAKILALTNLVAKSKAQPGQSPHIKICICYINENIDKKHSVSSLAKICEISPNYLSQIFKEEMGENLGSYIMRKKLEKSKELMLENKNIKTVYKAVGFSSQSHFITAFKRFYNMTPGQFLKLTK